MTDTKMSIVFPVRQEESILISWNNNENPKV